MKAGDLVQEAPKVLLCGTAGSGKTSLVLTLGSNVEILDADGNIRSGLHCGDGHDEERAKAEVTPCPEPFPESKPQAFNTVRKRIEKISQEVEAGTYERKVVAVDSLTTLTHAAMLETQRVSGNLKKNPSLPEWGTMANEVFRLITRLRALPIGVILIAHDEVIEVNERQRVQLGVMGKKLGQQLPRLFTDIWYVKTRSSAGGKQAFTIQPRPSGDFPQARNSGGLPGELDATKGLPPVFEALGYPLTS